MAQAATGASIRDRSGQSVAPGFADTFRSEWTKLVSVRSSWLTMGLGILLSIGFTILICAVIGANYDSLDPADRADLDPAETAVFGSVFLTICLAVLGVNFVANEYSSGMIRLTLATTPKRVRLLCAKIAVITIATLVTALVANLAMFFAGQLVLGASGAPHASIGDENVPRMLIGLTLVAPVFPVFGGMLAFVFRSTGSSITAIQALIFGPGIFGGILPDWWQRHFIAYLPGNASDSLSIGQFSENNRMYADVPIAFVALVAWIVVFVGLGWWSLTRRDA